MPTSQSFYNGAHHHQALTPNKALASGPVLTSFAGTRPAFLSIVKLLFFTIATIPFAKASPLAFVSSGTFIFDGDAKPADDPSLWLYLGTACLLVLGGGAFAGLTIALMGQDEIYLQVIAESGEGKEQKHAGKVLRLLNRGKHWVLVTLLLSNVITNETLPIVLDRSLGGGWPAVLGSTALIVIFGEIIPQSICVRYGLPIGAWMSPVVLGLMYLLAPLAWPTAKLLDWLLGEEHGTVYKKAGLKTLVTLHKTLGPTPGDRLNEDEVTIISAVLDLKAKPVGSIMTPMDDVFTMPSDKVLDEEAMDVILSAGYSRIPIHAPNNPNDFVGMLLVKILITYDPEDGKRVSDFALATLPETRPETSCLDIVNFFQEGKSHMVLVSDFPGENYGSIGVVTLEDVIEELIGEEIIDESDVYVDVHKAIRRLTPAPRTRVPKGQVTVDDSGKPPGRDGNLIDVEEDEAYAVGVARRASPRNGAPSKIKSPTEYGSSPKAPSIRRTSSVVSGQVHGAHALHKATDSESRDHLMHLGPSNLASRPRSTRYNTVKIKPAPGATGPSVPTLSSENLNKSLSGSIIGEARKDSTGHAPHGGVGEGLLSSAGKDAKDGVLAVQTGYGTLEGHPPRLSQSPEGLSRGNKSPKRVLKPGQYAENGRTHTPTPQVNHDSSSSTDTLESMRSGTDSRSRNRSAVARSGSITENVVEARGIRKVVLETTSSSDTEGSPKRQEGGGDGGNEQTNPISKANDSNEGSSNKKKRRRRRKKGGDENTPLLMAPIVHCVRHAQGFHNLSIANHLLPDPSLTALGEEQCHELNRKFPYLDKVDLILASPLRRTLYTALLGFDSKIRRGLTVLAVPELQETSDLPSDTGSNPAFLKEEFSDQPVDLHLVQDGWNSKQGRWSPNAKMVEERAREMRRMFRSRPEKEIVVVTHGGFLHYLTEDWAGSAKFDGTGWENAEFRSYRIDESSGEIRMLETDASKARRSGSEKPLSQDEQIQLMETTHQAPEKDGFQSNL